MPIVSVSLDNETISELNKIEKEFGFSNRSTALRACIKAFLVENKSTKKEEFSEAVFLLIHKEEKENKTLEIKHKFKEIIINQMHINLKNNNCLELFVLKGKTKSIDEFILKLNSAFGTKYSKVFFM
jgi:CopG family nickel-responsive transcriptional regulator